MSEKSWVLRGIDADNRQRAIAEAERLGVPIGDYLTDVVLRAALAEQAPAPLAPAPELEATGAEVLIGGFLSGYHVDALERGFGLAVDALDSVVSALDGSVCGLTARIDQAETLAAATAAQLNQTLHDTGDHLAALHQRLAAAEQQADALACAQEAMGEAFAAGLAQQAAAAQDAARAASEATAQLAAAHEALKYAVADDFITFARESASCLGAGLDEVRAAADRAAEQADAAMSHLFQEVRAASEAVEARLCESADETRARMQAAFADTAERMAALAGRVTDCEQRALHRTEQLDSQIADIEQGARDTRAALEGIRHGLSGEVAGLRAQQAEGAARLTQLDASSATLENDIAAMRRTMDARAAQAEEVVRAVLARAQAEWDARHETLRANGERIEACALAALEKVANDRAGGDAALHRELADVRDLASGAAARLTLLDRAIGTRELMAAVEAGAAPLGARLTQIEASLATRGEVGAGERELGERVLRLETAHENEATAHALAALRGQIGAIAAQLDAQQIESGQHLDELRERAEAGAIQGVARQVEEFEQRQQAAIEQLRADIAGLVDENARRLESLEQPAPSAVAAEFEALRRRVEERILDVEQRSVRALEQAADAMAALEQRFTPDHEVMLRSA